jgi:choline dehydrogenase
MTSNFDFIIVGAGSAGCILASRLSQDPSNTVALIEAGGGDKSIFIKMPSALAIPMNTKRYNWGYNSEPEAHLGGRVIPCYRGKGLGGSSSINGLVFVRGNARDFNEWEEHGASGWNYETCLPYFKRLENWQGGASDVRGGEGPISVTTGNDRQLNPLYDAFIDAGVEAGYPRCADYNGASQEGFGPMQMNVGGGVRASTGRAYLQPVANRPNLTVFKNTLTHRICFEGKKAVGVEVSSKGKTRQIMAGREVILSAGAIGSPQLLQLSGVGPEAILKNAGVTPHHIRAGVGENLTDHLEVFFQYECTQPITLNGKLDPFNKALIGLRWLLFKNGLGATNHFESCGFIKSADTKAWPDIQYHFLPGAISYDGNTAFKGHGYQVHVGPNKPASRGHIHIQTADVADHPKIQFNYLQHDADRADWRNTIRITRNVLNQDALSPYRGAEIQPGLEITSDAAIDDWVEQNVESAYHPTSTCRMGSPSDPMAVVDPTCRVIGLENLRVVDSSIFPTIPNGNLNAPTMMVAEKAADIILGN